jgi:hypothetical protein
MSFIAYAASAKLCFVLIFEEKHYCYNKNNSTLKQYNSARAMPYLCVQWWISVVRGFFSLIASSQWGTEVLEAVMASHAAMDEHVKGVCRRAYQQLWVVNRLKDVLESRYLRNPHSNNIHYTIRFRRCYASMN